MLSSLKKSEVLSNLLFIGAGDFGSRALSFVAFMYLARVLGPDRLGLIGFGASAIALAAPFVDYGLGFVGTREVSRDPSSLKFYIKTILFNRILLGIISLLCYVAVATFMFDDGEKTKILLLYGLTLLPAVLTLTWAYQGIGQTGWFPVEKNLQAILYCLGLFLFVRQPGDFNTVPVSYAVSAFVPAIGILVYYWYTLRKGVGSLDVRYSIGLLKSSFKLFVPTFLSQMSLSIGLLLVVYFGSIREAGYFSAASRIMLLSAAIPNLLWSSFYPALSRNSSREPERSKASVAILYKYAVLIGVVPLFFGFAYSRELVNILFGASYEEAVVPFRLFSAVAALQFLSIVMTRILPAFGMERTFSRIVTGGVVLQVLASLVLVPRWGASGAALSFILSEVAMGSAAILVVRRMVVFNLLKTPVVSLVALASCALIVTAIRSAVEIPILPSLLAIGAFYFILLAATSFISRKDFSPREMPVR